MYYVCMGIFGSKQTLIYHNNMQVILSESNTVLSAQSRSVNQYVNIFSYRVLPIEQRVTKKRIKKNILMKNCAGILLFQNLEKQSFVNVKAARVINLHASNYILLL